MSNNRITTMLTLVLVLILMFVIPCLNNVRFEQKVYALCILIFCGLITLGLSILDEIKILRDEFTKDQKERKRRYERSVKMSFRPMRDPDDPLPSK
jgi:hypothetical protein